MKSFTNNSLILYLNFLIFGFYNSIYNFYIIYYIMKLTRILKITEKEFYDFLENDLISNIYKFTNQKVSRIDIKKGLKYTKYDDNAHIKLDILILEYKRGEIFKSSTKSMFDKITISFQTEIVDEGLKIIFNQNIESFEKEKHNKFMRLFSEAVYYGRMSDTLYDIQKKIIAISKN